MHGGGGRGQEDDTGGPGGVDASMCPQEVINNLGSLKARGGWTSRRSAALMDEKLERRGVMSGSPRSRRGRGETGGAGRGDGRAAGAGVTDEQVKRGRISRPTALMVDKSGRWRMRWRSGSRSRRWARVSRRRSLVVEAFDASVMLVRREGTAARRLGAGLPAAPGGRQPASAAPLEAMRLERQWRSS